MTRNMSVGLCFCTQALPYGRYHRCVGWGKLVLRGEEVCVCVYVQVLKKVERSLF